MAKIITNQSIANRIYKMVLYAPSVVRQIQGPGQFINLYPKEKHTLLPRPISICEFDRENKTITVVYAVVGDGTKQFSKMNPDDTIQVSGPMGNGFQLGEKTIHHVLVGGGIGVPPLLELAKHLQGNITAVLGFRSDPILIQEFEKLGVTVYVATEDGSYGHKGNVIDILNNKEITGKMFYSCGPKPMLKALTKWCMKYNIPVQVSLEERMGCGIGVCVGCVCKEKDKDSKQGWSHKKICTDGPVFWGREVIWDE